VAIATGLLKINRDGCVLPGSNNWSVETQTTTVKKMCFAVEKFGAWLAPLSLREISLTLHVRF